MPNIIKDVQMPVSIERECPYPKSSPNLALFPEGLEVQLQENRHLETPGNTLQVGQCLSQTVGWVDRVTSATSSTSATAPSATVIVASDEAPPPSYDQVMQPSLQRILPAINSQTVSNYPREIDSQQNNIIINWENRRAASGPVDTVNVCAGSALSIFFLFIFVFVLYQFLSRPF